MDSDQTQHSAKNEEYKKDLAHYRNVLQYLGANVPIACLCLPKVVERKLVDAGCLRVYDLINRDLREIKGIGKGSVDLLASRLYEFFSIST